MIPPEQGPWTPIASGALAERCGSIVEAISGRIAERVTQWMERNNYVIPVHYWLSQGYSGMALLFAYLAACGAGRDSLRHADEFEEKALSGMAGEIMNGTFFDGFAGIAWSIAHRRGFLSNTTADEEEFEDVSSRIAAVLVRARWPADYDLMLGIVGVGVYFLENPQWAVSAQCLPEIVRHLSEIAERRGELTTWHTPASFLPPHQRKIAPDGYYNLGMAHGVPGVIAFLSKAREFAGGRAEELLYGAVNWVLAQEQDSGELRFPTWVTPDGGTMRSRLAWCYGDLGIACALLRAAQSTGNAEWRERGVAVAERCLTHPALTELDDVCLCHGLGGIGHCFNRIYHATGDDRFKEAAVTAFTRVCELWNPDGDTWTGFPIAKDFGRDIPSVLEGSAGVALSLLAATTSQRPEWDRMFLMDVPVATK